jgi:hypothetical protein
VTSQILLEVTHAKTRSSFGRNILAGECNPCAARAVFSIAKFVPTLGQSIFIFAIERIGYFFSERISYFVPEWIDRFSEPRICHDGSELDRKSFQKR